MEVLVKPLVSLASEVTSGHQCGHWWPAVEALVKPLVRLTSEVTSETTGEPKIAAHACQNSYNSLISAKQLSEGIDLPQCRSGAVATAEAEITGLWQPSVHSDVAF